MLRLWLQNKNLNIEMISLMVHDFLFGCWMCRLINTQLLRITIIFIEKYRRKYSVKVIPVWRVHKLLACSWWPWRILPDSWIPSNAAALCKLGKMLPTINARSKTHVNVQLETVTVRNLLTFSIDKWKIWNMVGYSSCPS